MKKIKVNIFVLKIADVRLEVGLLSNCRELFKVSPSSACAFLAAAKFCFRYHYSTPMSGLLDLICLQARLRILRRSSAMKCCETKGRRHDATARAR
ncbi:hypothetical protein D3C84_1173340 [compost metagenome]